jgi:hypothetical protein
LTVTKSTTLVFSYGKIQRGTQNGFCFQRYKQQAYELIDRMAPSQVAAVVGLLETMLDPFARALANAPIDDEPVSEEEAREIEAAHASLERGEGISHNEVLAEYGLTPADFDRMGHTSLDPNGAGR